MSGSALSVEALAQATEVLPCRSRPSRIAGGVMPSEADCAEQQARNPNIIACVFCGLRPSVATIIQNIMDERDQLRARIESYRDPGVKWDGRLGGGRWVPYKLYQQLRDDRDRARELIAYLLADAAHTDWGDCEPWDSIMDAQKYLDRREEK